MNSRLVKFAILIVILPCLSSCDSLSYYHQAISGQLYILTHRQNIERLLSSAQTDSQLKEQLRQVNQLRNFAEQSLQLPVDDQFSSYVDLKRPYVVWNVFAASEFSLDAVSWCYPVAGCVSYRGFFMEDAAQKYASEMRGEGYEVYVGGVTAYSTLGWFSDPVLNTVISRRPDQLGSLVFHELAHQVVYLRGDTSFNEGFATAVEQLGVRLWINTNMPVGSGNELLARIELDLQRRAQFVALVQAAIEDLQQIYASNTDAEQMRKQKNIRTGQLREDYVRLKSQWGGYSAYDAWFSGELNNAQLSTVGTYNDLVPVFRQIFADCDEVFSCMYEQANALADMSAIQREQHIEQLRTRIKSG